MQSNTDDVTNSTILNKKDKKIKRFKIKILKDNSPNLIFTNQVFRKDILENMLLNINLTGNELFNLIMNENKGLNNERRKGWIFESLCQILIVLKCIENTNYNEIYNGQLQNLRKIQNINSLLNVKIDGGGNNIVDMAINDENTLILFTIKYKNKYSETDVSKIDNTITKQNISDDYKIGLIVKDKSVVINHKYKNKLNIDKQLHDKIIKNGLLFDEKDIIKGLYVFSSRFSNNQLSINEFINFIDTEYLISPKQQLTKKLHQRMTELKFINSFLRQKEEMYCISHKPRSGKSITILLICKYLLENNYKKILIMTSVPATINSFVNDIEKYIDFKNVNYKMQDEFSTINESFNGIVFCSVQYLKTNGKIKKRDLLKNIGFDAIIIDESHQGSSTYKTKTDILDVDQDVESIRKNTKLTIFASGTSDKTQKYYAIKPRCVYEWEIEDEAFMKEIVKPEVKNREEIVQYMVNRHGNTFLQCLHDETLNKDYSKHPIQVLMKYSIPESLIHEINAYNSKYGTNFGYCCSSLFGLKKVINENNEYEYVEEFELCKTTDGEDILKGFLDNIISSDRMRKTIMKQIETTQTSRGSRKSTRENPLLFIIYLPTHTRNNTISLLQKTLKQFLESNDLWSDYNIEYSNSTEDTGIVKEEYNEYIKTIMNKTKIENKKGCILLLGNKGSVGITYNDCDVTISLDDGHNLDNQKQRYSRALTEASNKTIGINVDMNIQRTYLYLIDIIQNHRKNIKTTRTNSEILYYLFEHNIFLFDPQEINNGKLRTTEILSYYEKESETMMEVIDDTLILEQIICDDSMREFIKMDFNNRQLKKINKDLEGEQQHCPKGDKSKIEIDPPYNNHYDSDDSDDNDNDDNEENENIECLINKTYEMCKSFLFPLLAIMSRSYKIFDFKKLFINEITGNMIVMLLLDKQIELNANKYIIIVNIMSNIIDNNQEIVNTIREIYNIAPPDKLRKLIEKHFIPTNDEKKQYAEVPTSVILVDEMLDRIDLDFWKTPHKVFEPCCGKGNFVLGIFDRFYKNLEEMYPDNIERCRIIMTECIYYADISALNVFITTEIMKCYIQKYTGLDEFDFEFNSYIGDTLDFNIEEKWNLLLSEVSIIGNPPYSTDPSKSNTKPLYNKFIEKYINGKLLLFVVPSRWFVGGKGLDSFRDFMMKRKDIVFIEHQEKSKTWFGNNIDIEGGVNYFLKDSSHNGLCLFNGIPYDLSKYDCVIKPKYHTIIDKVIGMENISKLYKGRCFGVETNDKRFKDSGKVKCYVSTLKSKDRCKYMNDYPFNEKTSFWKVITARANGKNPNFGAKFIGKPNEIHTGSYISFRVKNEAEANSLLSYLDTKFANYMLSVRKISQDISENTCKWIPLVPLDRIWNDDKVCEYLKIDSNLYI
jgi:hypothetical protein